jgi:transposase
MNQSLLQKAFGVSGHYRCVRVDYHWGSVQFHLDLKAEALVCPQCRSAQAVIRKGRRGRILQTVPIGLKPVYLVTEVARCQCRRCEVIFEIAPPLPERKSITPASSRSLSRGGAG